MNNSAATKSFRYRSNEIEIPEDEPFSNDKLGREPFVQATTELLQVIQEPFVIAVNAPWGSGKSTTFKLLEQQLKTNNFTTVSFNAWEVDYSTDPLVPLVATLHERLLEIQGTDPSLTPAAFDRFKLLAGKLAKHTAVAAIKVVTVGALDAAEIADDIADAVKTASEDLTSDVIDAFQREKDAAEQFRKLLEDITQKARQKTEEGKAPPPVVLLIDELDRCRPTFAVAMLERIKHFFSVPGLVFVLALDIEQLKASTRKVYGAEMDAEEYLRRFIDLELRLPRADMKGMVQGMLSNCGADDFFSARKENHYLREEQELAVSTISTLSKYFGLTPRTVQRMISRLMLVIRQTPIDNYLDPIPVIFMIFLRMRDEELLRHFVAGRISAQNVMESVEKFGIRGEEFRVSHEGQLIEAHLVFAQGEGFESAHTADFLKYAQEIKEKKMELTLQENRVLSVSQCYQRVCNKYYDRGAVSLKILEQRINLVSSDLSKNL